MTNISLLAYQILIFFAVLQVRAEVLPLKIEGKPYKPGALSMVAVEKKQGLVVVFLSAKCPCSNSHVQEVRELADLFANYQFVGVHSNVDESVELTREYFDSINLPFPVLQDSKAKIADEFKASKTPHVFVVNLKGELVYQGGVSSRARFSPEGTLFLREALTAINAGKEVKVAIGRTLGCGIIRE